MPTFRSAGGHAAYRKMPASSGSDHNVKGNQEGKAYEDSNVQIPELPKISHELIHPFLHLTDSRRFTARVFSKLVKLQHVPVR